MYVFDELTIILGYSKKFQIMLIVIIFIINERGEIYQSTFTIDFAHLTFDASLYTAIVIMDT